MVDLRHLLIDIENQRHYNSCVGKALSTYLEAIWVKFSGESAKEFSPAFIWKGVSQEAGRNENRGISPTAALEFLKKKGCCLESTFPYIDENLNRFPPADAYKEAKTYRIGSWKPVQLHEIKSYLDKGLPVAASMDFGGNHMVCIFGYNTVGYIVVNSWGVQWMQQGTQVIPFAEFNARFRQSYAITGLKWQWLKSAKQWFKQAFK